MGTVRLIRPTASMGAAVAVAVLAVALTVVATSAQYTPRFRFDGTFTTDPSGGRFEVTLIVPARSADLVRPGQAVRLHIGAPSGRNSADWQGRVVQASRVPLPADARGARALVVVLSGPNDAAKARGLAGMPVEAEITGRPRRLIDRIVELVMSTSQASRGLAPSA